jgi:hypothetical protein
MSHDRAAYREAVAQIAQKAKATLPDAVNGRIEKAVALVLHGDVEPQSDDSVVVFSSTDATHRYVLTGQACTCADFERGQAPQGWCQHRIAAGIAKRVGELVPDSDREATAAPLGEAPASVNVRVMVLGHETAVLERLQALLKRADIRPVPKPAPRSGGWKKGR